MSQTGLSYKKLTQLQKYQSNKCLLLYAGHSISTRDLTSERNGNEHGHWRRCLRRNLPVKNYIKGRKNKVEFKKQSTFPREVTEAAEPQWTQEWLSFREREELAKVPGSLSEVHLGDSSEISCTQHLGRAHVLTHTRLHLANIWRPTLNMTINSSPDTITGAGSQQ